MRKITAIAATLLLGLSVNVLAAEKQKPASAPEAATAQKQEARSIFSYKKELGLSDKQEADIKKFIADLQNTFTEAAKKINSLRQELSQMLQDRVDLKVIRRKIENIAKIQVDNTYQDIEISRKIEGILSSDQLKKWRDIQKQAYEKIKAASQSQQQQEEPAAKGQPAAKGKK